MSLFLDELSEVSSEGYNRLISQSICHSDQPSLIEAPDQQILSLLRGYLRLIHLDLDEAIEIFQRIATNEENAEVKIAALSLLTSAAKKLTRDEDSTKIRAREVLESLEMAIERGSQESTGLLHAFKGEIQSVIFEDYDAALHSLGQARIAGLEGYSLLEAKGYCYMRKGEKLLQSLPKNRNRTSRGIGRSRGSMGGRGRKHSVGRTSSANTNQSKQQETDADPSQQQGRRYINQALSRIEKAIEQSIGKASPVLMSRKARCLSTLGRREETLEVLSQNVREAEEDNFGAEFAYFERAKYYWFATRDPDKVSKAIEDAHSALAKCPEHESELQIAIRRFVIKVNKNVGEKIPSKSR